jgi:hypothetical protein
MKDFGISDTARASFYLDNTERRRRPVVEGLGLVAGIVS